MRFQFVCELLLPVVNFLMILKFIDKISIYEFTLRQSILKVDWCWHFNGGFVCFKFVSIDHRITKWLERWIPKLEAWHQIQQFVLESWGKIC